MKRKLLISLLLLLMTFCVCGCGTNNDTDRISYLGCNRTTNGYHYYEFAADQIIESLEIEYSLLSSKEDYIEIKYYHIYYPFASSRQGSTGAFTLMTVFIGDEIRFSFWDIEPEEIHIIRITDRNNPETKYEQVMNK